MEGINIQKFGDRTIAIGGIGKLFFQEGFPIGISISHLKAKGIEVSMFHVADEMLKHLWASGAPATKVADRVIAMLKNEIEDAVIEGANNIDIQQLEKFCHAEYEDQREMIFQYLFGATEKDKNKFAAEWLKNHYDEIKLANQ